MPSSPVRKILYQCSHELCDPRYQSPRKPSLVNRVKRALTSTETIRTPSSELCPYCQRLEEEKKRVKAATTSRPAAQPRRQTSPLRPHGIGLKRSNTVAEPSMVTQTADPEPDSYFPPRNPYRDTSMEKLRVDFDALYMEERVREGLAKETPADRKAREFKEELVRKDWKVRSAAREYNEFVLDQAPEPAPGPAPPTDLKQLFAQAKRAQAPAPASETAPAVSEPQQWSLRTRIEVRKVEKALEAERVRSRAQEIAKRCK
ncbi:hypothetical protein EAF04_008811 [Stromatinia cepivora]|nr:hypothetical protein EAF04_008811 [Stromatinia cepivora]